MTKGDDAEALTVARVATVLGVHKNTVRNLIRRGSLPAFFVGRSLRVARVDLLEYRRRYRYNLRKQAENGALDERSVK